MKYLFILDEDDIMPPRLASLCSIAKLIATVNTTNGRWSISNLGNSESPETLVEAIIRKMQEPSNTPPVLRIVEIHDSRFQASRWLCRASSNKDKWRLCNNREQAFKFTDIHEMTAAAFEFIKKHPMVVNRYQVHIVE